MAYVQPFPYVAGTPLDKDKLKENEESLQTYVNQEIVKTDIANESLEMADIAKGIYNPVLENFSFVSVGS